MPLLTGWSSLAPIGYAAGAACALQAWQLHLTQQVDYAASKVVPFLWASRL